MFKSLMVGNMLPGTPLNIRQKARVLWQSLNLLSQLMFRTHDVTILRNFHICVHARVVSRMNSTDIRTSC